MKVWAGHFPGTFAMLGRGSLNASWILSLIFGFAYGFSSHVSIHTARSSDALPGVSFSSKCRRRFIKGQL